MGYYIETGAAHGKVAALQQMLDAIEITQDEAEFFIKEDVGAVLCVVDNGLFEAAAYCHNLSSFRAFTQPTDDRPKTWLYAEDRAKVRELTRFNAALSH